MCTQQVFEEFYLVRRGNVPPAPEDLSAFALLFELIITIFEAPCAAADTPSRFQTNSAEPTMSVFLVRIVVLATEFILCFVP